MPETFYVADLHFGHKNGLAFDNRPWTTIEDHDAAIIENWNDQVGYDDIVYILGDISWHNVTKTNEILSQLNGEKHLVRGNHDSKFLRNKDFRDCFVEICNYRELGKGEDMIVLSHYPIPFFNQQHAGATHLYGHVHITPDYQMTEHMGRLFSDRFRIPFKAFNVGIMLPYMEWRPQPIERIISGGFFQRAGMVSVEDFE